MGNDNFPLLPSEVQDVYAAMLRNDQAADCIDEILGMVPGVEPPIKRSLFLADCRAFFDQDLRAILEDIEDLRSQLFAVGEDAPHRDGVPVRLRYVLRYESKRYGKSECLSDDLSKLPVLKKDQKLLGVWELKGKRYCKMSDQKKEK